MEYKAVLSPKAAAVHEIMLSDCPGIDCCLYEKGRNLTLEVPKSDCERVVTVLKKYFEDVVPIRKVYAMIEDLHGYILVKPMITESPLSDERGIPIPSLEKELIDMYSDKEFAGMSRQEKDRTFQQSFEIYPVNLSRLFRYAGRKGKKEETRQRVEALDYQRIQLIQSLQASLSASPARKAWLFGSYARREERPDSDIDILVQFDPAVPIGLMAFSELLGNLEQVSGKCIDLVAEGSVKPFALDSINRDKMLIYERSCQG